MTTLPPPDLDSAESRARYCQLVALFRANHPHATDAIIAHSAAETVRKETRERRLMTLAKSSQNKTDGSLSIDTPPPPRTLASLAAAAATAQSTPTLTLQQSQQPLHFAIKLRADSQAQPQPWPPATAAPTRVAKTEARPNSCSNPTCAGASMRHDVRLLSSCSGCMIAAYCSRDCQLRHWKHGHKRECASLKQRIQPPLPQPLSQPVPVNGTSHNSTEKAEVKIEVKTEAPRSSSPLPTLELSSTELQSLSSSSLANQLSAAQSIRVNLSCHHCEHSPKRAGEHSVLTFIACSVPNCRKIYCSRPACIAKLPAHYNIQNPEQFAEQVQRLESGADGPWVCPHCTDRATCQGPKCIRRWSNNKRKMEEDATNSSPTVVPLLSPAPDGSANGDGIPPSAQLMKSEVKSEAPIVPPIPTVSTVHSDGTSVTRSLNSESETSEPVKRQRVEAPELGLLSAAAPWPAPDPDPIALSVPVPTPARVSAPAPASAPVISAVLLASLPQPLADTCPLSSATNAERVSDLDDNSVSGTYLYHASSIGAGDFDDVDEGSKHQRERSRRRAKIKEMIEQLKLPGPLPPSANINTLTIVADSIEQIKRLQSENAELRLRMSHCPRCSPNQLMPPL